MLFCLRCGRSLRIDEVIKLEIACPWCGVDITVRICPECAKAIIRALEEQLRALGEAGK